MMTPRVRSMVVVAAFCLLVPTLAAASDIQRGRAIYRSVASEYPGLTPSLGSGVMGENARLVADLPLSKWKKMTTPDRRALAAFVKSELSTVRSSPSLYSLTPTTAPIWPTHHAAFERICDECWEIHTGRYDRHDRALAGDDWSVAMKGGAPRETVQNPTMLHEANLKPLTATNAANGVKLYSAAGVHEATIVGVDAAVDRITVRYVRDGASEPKVLSALGKFWFVK
jgi:hypothetical protein